ncbi:hypothetical protein [Oceanirhabdus sp. W0125-5]|uniref:hypothetical protein n=1 Tax=Oceanirhabdus sp. W0125-5 TaxID=2999116 RepID=UPI0022F2A52F|nr:hypothetical protein [Oceanirhabdus sp. W0125-5]WBW98384.1 hypothetical protein OW730_06340 [Oceanirhabdus sp. W0125-5]
MAKNKFIVERHYSNQSIDKLMKSLVIVKLNQSMKEQRDEKTNDNINTALIKDESR